MESNDVRTVCAMIIAFAAALFAAPAYSQAITGNVDLPEGLNSGYHLSWGKKGKSIDLKISSRVKKANKLNIWIRALERKYPDFKNISDYERKKLLSLPAFEYQYIFNNESDVPIRINLSDLSIVHSPFTDVIQGFDLLVEAKTQKNVNFIGFGKCKCLITPVNLAGWNKSAQKWDIIGGGKAELYCPEFGFYIAGGIKSRK